jgi:hypothetical protein
MNRTEIKEIKAAHQLSNVILLRCFAILSVVLGHAMIIYSDSWHIFEPKIQSSFFNCLKKYIDVFQMPLFIALSGYVFYFVRNEKKRYGKFFPFISNKFLRLIIPYLAVAIFYVLPIRILVHYTPYNGQSVLSLLWNCVFLSKDIGHLWYLPTLFGIFILFYALEKWLDKCPVFITIPVLLFFSSASILFPATLNICNIGCYLCFFHIGYVLKNVKLGGVKFGVLIILISGVLQFAGILSVFQDAESSKIISFLNILIQRLSSFSSIIFWFLVFTEANTLFPNLVKNKYVQFIDRKSFAIYLFHSPLMYIVLFFLADTDIQPVVLVFINFTVCMLGSIAVSQMIRKTGFLNFVIGEK